jgi:hypothetical protein
VANRRCHSGEFDGQTRRLVARALHMSYMTFAALIVDR